MDIYLNKDIEISIEISRFVDILVHIFDVDKDIEIGMYI